MLAVCLGPRCAACAAVLDTVLDGPVCAACWARIARLPEPTCRTCGDPLPSWRVVSAALACCPRCRRRPPPLAAARAAGDYAGALRAILHAFKYDGRRSLAAPLAAMAAEAGRELLRDATCAVPVPLHPWRRLHRGYNQAAEIASRLDVPVVHAVWRIRATPPQTGLTARARRRNVRGAFRVSPLLSRTSLDRYVRGGVVVLVDDVRTTGATLEACAAELLREGAREVRAVTVARAAAPVAARGAGRRAA